VAAQGTGGACEGHRDAARRSGAAEARKNLAWCLAGLGRGAYQANRAAQAVVHYRAARDAYPEAPELWTGLAVALVKAGDVSGAEGALREAELRFPAHAEVLYLLAELDERQGRTREATATLQRLFRLEPHHARGRALAGRLEREQKVEGAYWSEESAHFLVRYEGAEAIDVGRSVVDILEEAYDSIGRELGVTPSERIQVGIYATQVFGEVIGAPPHLIAGAYDGRKIRLNLAASRAYSRDLSRLVRHEYTHAVVHLLTQGRAPIWLHEGLAQVMEPRAAPRLLDTGVPREYLTLQGIERLARTPRPEAVVAGYQLCHVAVEYLMEQGGAARMRDFLQRLGRGQPIGAAMREAFGVGPEDVEARLLRAAGRG
jgi:tetratricopeptide (TPR) repeat protein